MQQTTINKNFKEKQLRKQQDFYDYLQRRTIRIELTTFLNYL